MFGRSPTNLILRGPWRMPFRFQAPKIPHQFASTARFYTSQAFSAEDSAAFAQEFARGELARFPEPTKPAQKAE